MVTASVGVRLVQAGLVVRVVIQRTRLVGIDMPDRRTRHLGGHRRICQAMIQISGLAEEHVGIRIITAILPPGLGSRPQSTL